MLFRQFDYSFKHLLHFSFLNYRLGATPIMELMIASGKTITKLQLEHGLAVDRVYVGSFMTSLDMAGRSLFMCYYYDGLVLIVVFLSGFSITIMKADQSILQRLDAATRAPAWPVGVDGACAFKLFPPPCYSFSMVITKRDKSYFTDVGTNLQSEDAHAFDNMLIFYY